MAIRRRMTPARADLGDSVPAFPALVRFALLVVALSFSSAAAADEIRVVTAGDAFASEGDSGFALIGKGFRFEGEVPPGITAALGQCVIFLCSPGDTVHLGATVSPHLFDPEPATFDGRDFESVFLQGELLFDAPTITVPVVAENGFAEMRAPFSFTGQLSAFDNAAFSGDALFSTRLRGRGTVAISFTNSAEFGTFADRVSYRFEDEAATPEPSSILLLASGIGGLIARRRRSERL